MKYNLVVVGPESNPLVDQFSDLAFKVILSSNHPNRGTVGSVNTWIGTVNGVPQSISDPSILIIREDQTSTGVQLTLVGGVDKAVTENELRVAYNDALSGVVTTGSTTGGNTPGGEGGSGQFGFGNGILSLPNILWIIAAGYSLGKYQKTKNPLYLGTAGIASINIIKKYL